MRSTLRTTVAAGAGLAVAAGVLIAVGSPAGAAGFGANFVVYQVGSGSALTGASAPVQLVEYSADGSSTVSSTSLPTVAGDGQHRLTAGGTSDSEGLLTLSPDGRYLAFTGYDADAGTTGPGSSPVSASAPSTVGRTVGVAWSTAAGSALTIDTSTVLSGSGTPYIPRSAVTTDGNTLWVAGGNGGVLAASRGGSTASRIAGADATNLTQVTVAGGQLFAAGVGDVTPPAADASPAYNAITAGTQVRKVGTGTPTSGAAALAGVTGLPTISEGPLSYLPYGVAYLDLGAASYAGTGIDTAYVANGADRGGAVDKYVFNGTTFVNKGTVFVDGAFGIAATVSGGTVVVAVTTGDEVVTLTDASAATSTLTAAPQHLVSAPSGRVFRGIAVAPSVSTGPAVLPAVTVTAPTAGQSVAPSVASLAVTGTASSASGIDSVKVRLDSGSWRTATLTGSSWKVAVPLAGAARGSHTLTVVATDSSAAHATRTVTRAFTLAPVVVPKGAVGPGTVSVNAKQVTLKGFASAAYAKAPGGKGAKATKKGSTASVRFVGRTLQVHLGIRKNGGKVKVTVDGKSQKVDLYGKKSADAVVSFSGLSYGTHRVTVKALGKKSAKSKGTVVLVGWLQVGL